MAGWLGWLFGLLTVDTTPVRGAVACRDEDDDGRKRWANMEKTLTPYFQTGACRAGCREGRLSERGDISAWESSTCLSVIISGTYFGCPRATLVHPIPFHSIPPSYKQATSASSKKGSPSPSPSPTDQRKITDHHGWCWTYMVHTHKAKYKAQRTQTHKVITENKHSKLQTYQLILF